MSGVRRSLYLLAVGGLVGILAMGGCAKKTVTATTSGAEAVSAKPPVQETPKENPKENPKEIMVQAPPTMVAKADDAEIAARKAREAAQKALQDIYFAFDKWTLTDEGKKILTQSSGALKQAPTVKLLLEGHCDERGSREYNLVLGEKRAKVVQQFLLDLGVTNPMGVTSYGKEKSVCTEHDESCYWKNRRAHMALETYNGK